MQFQNWWLDYFLEEWLLDLFTSISEISWKSISMCFVRHEGESTRIHSIQEGALKPSNKVGEVLCKLLSSFINQNSPIYFGENGCCIIQWKLLSSFLHYRVSIFHVVNRRKRENHASHKIWKPKLRNLLQVTECSAIRWPINILFHEWMFNLAQHCSKGNC